MHKIKTITKTIYNNNSFDDLTENEFNENMAEIYKIYKENWTSVETLDHEKRCIFENIFLKQIERGNLYVLKWLHENCHPITFESHWNYKSDLSLPNIKHNNILDLATAGGHAHILDYLHTNNLISKHPLPKENVIRFEYDVINKAVRNCQILSLEWFYNHQEYHKFDYKFQWEDYDCCDAYYDVAFDSVDFEKVSEDKIIELMEWYNTHYDCNRDIMYYGTYFVNRACEHNYIKILDWLHNNPEYDFNYSNDGLMQSIDAPPGAMSKNKTDVLEWFHKHRNYYKIDYNKILKFAIKKNLDDVVKWFSSIASVETVKN